MKNATELKDDLEGIDASDVERTMKERGRAGYEYARESLESAREAMREAIRPVGLKTVLGVLAGTAVVIGAICLARRRRPRGNMLQRGIHEGVRYAMLVPEGWDKTQKHAYEGWHKTRKHAHELAEDVARESGRLWKKIPRVHVEIK